MKLCAHCRRVLDRESFSRDRRAKSGLRSWCKDCVRDGMHYVRRGVDTPSESAREWPLEPP